MLLSKNNRNIVLKTLLCGFSILLLAGSAAAWDQAFESHPSDLPSTSFTSSKSGEFTLSSVSGEHGIVGRIDTTYKNPSDGFGMDINQPFTGYLGFSICASGSRSESNAYIYWQLLDTNGNILYTTQNMLFGYSGYSGNNVWHFCEVIQNGNSLNLYKDGNLIATNTFTYTGTPAKQRLVSSTGSYTGNAVLVDDLTSSSSHSIIGMDSAASVNDANQYYKLGVPNLPTGKYYEIKMFSPDDKVAYTKQFTNASQIPEQSIPAANMSVVGEYTLHLYRYDSESSAAFLTMKSFTLSDPAGTSEGSILVDKDEYQTGDTVGFWVHLKSYAAGYKVVCEFPTSGTNFKKSVDVTSDTFHGTFTIPDHSAVIGSHVVTLLNPSGKQVATDDFNVFIPGLPDIAFDKSNYERTDKVNLYYKDVKSGSTITVLLRYGGSTAQTLTYPVSGTGTLVFDLSSLPAADSMLAVVKDSDGYSNDDDSAKIMVGKFLLSGRVYDAKTGEALSGATVTVLGNVTNTDTSGNYNLSALGGFDNYSVVKTGYQTISGTVAVFDLNTIHNFYLTKTVTNGGTGVHGTVVSSKTDYPLVGASVVVINNDNGKRFSTIANNAGYYELNNADLSGNLTVTASYSNYDTLAANTLVNAGSLNNINFRLNAVAGYVEIDPSEHTGGQDSADPGKTATEKAYEEKYGSMGQHPFDFNGDGQVENSEWKYAGERLIMLIGILAFMGFLMLINRRR